MNLKLNTALTALSVFALSFATLFLCMDRNINIYDEGIVLTAAMRINAGDIPHRDFYILYGPAEPYILAWMFDIFGQIIIVERVFDLIVRSGIVSIVYISLTFYCRRLVTIFITTICALWLYSIGNHAYPVYPALLLAIISSIMMVHILSSKTSVVYSIVAGLLTGLAALFRYDIGFFIFVANSLSAILVFFVSKDRQESIINFFIRKLKIYTIATGLPVAGILIWYWSNGTISSFVHDVILFPGQYYARTRSLPFPGFISGKSGVVYVPLMVVLCTALLSALKQKTRKIISKTNRHHDKNVTTYLIVFTSLTIMFYLKGIVRISPEHMQLTLIPALMVLALLIEIGISYEKWLRPIIAIPVVITSLAAFDFAQHKIRHGESIVIKDLSGFYYKLASGLDVSKINNIHTDDSRMGSNSIFPFLVDSNRDAATRFMVRNTNPNERIFSGLFQHDRIFVNDISIYFQTQRLPATKWHDLNPGLQTRADVQAKIIQELEFYGPRYIWLESTWNDVNEPNESANSSGVKILDEYIRGKYQHAKSFGKISIWQRQAINQK